MGAIGECCCCCGPITLPESLEIDGNTIAAEDWMPSGECCFVAEIELESQPWTALCTYPLYTDSRYAIGTYEVYAKEGPVTIVTDPDGSGDVNCTVIKGVGVVCEVDGVGANPCPEEDTLCATVVESRSIDTKQLLVGRWRKTGYRVYYYRVQTTCNSETEPTCKWIVAVQMLVDVQYGYKASSAEEHTADLTAAACCDSFLFNPVSREHATCDELADTLSTTIHQLEVTRSKSFDTQPSGSISFAEGEKIDCADGVPCINLENTDDEFSVPSTESPAFPIPWTAPECVNDVDLDDSVCYSFYQITYTGMDVCIAVPYPITDRVTGGPTTFLSGIKPGLDPTCTRSCRLNTEGQTYYDLATHTITRYVCTNIETDDPIQTGYIPQTLEFHFPTMNMVVTP